jgi:ppGpp synthetase/RelA/SpoT-type nucleotidyltranferase
LIAKLDFLSKYHLSYKFRESGYRWSEIEEIVEDYEQRTSSIEENRDQLALRFSKMELSIYIKKRTKDAEHLAEKVIRKAYESRNADYLRISARDYLSRLNDLIGIRIIHTFKEDWREIHLAFLELFDSFVEKPRVYYREGDDVSLYNEFLGAIEIEASKRNYRSAHYVVRQNGYNAEIQTRTIFEEAWGEVDHSLVYPLRKDDELLTHYSRILNRISGAGDEISSMMKAFATVYDKHKERQESLDSNMSALREMINSLELDQASMDKMQELLKRISLEKAELIDRGF